ncbi:MAG: hypothetical protein HY236_17490, partial [Acidobacteria bacterium]|nr:hypothetical protein [Acidobacteriota bacterium]
MALTDGNTNRWMRRRTGLLASVLCAAPLLAHPMGNFSVNHYSRLAVKAGRIRLNYVLDLAEIPTFQEMQTVGADPDRLPGGEELQRYAERRAAEWIAGLELQCGGRAAAWQAVSARAEFAPGAGGLPTLKVFIQAEVPGGAGEVRYRDNNFPGRTGWKEIVIRGAAARLEGAESFTVDVSQGLANYPADLYTNPPQVLEAAFRVMPPALPPPPKTLSAPEPEPSLRAAPEPPPVPAGRA